MRRFLFFVLSFSFTALTGFIVLSASSLNAFASDSYSGASVTLTASQTRALFGSTIECTYFNGSNYVDATYTYKSTPSYAHPNISGTSLNNNTVWLRYDSTFTTNMNPSYITLHLKPAISFTDTYEIHAGLGVESYNSVPVSPPYNSSHWEIYQNGVKSLIPLIGSESDGVFTPSTFIFNAPKNDVLVFAVDSIYSSPSTVSFGDVYLYGVSATNGSNTIYIACPTFSVTGASVTGIVTAPPGGGGGDSGSSIDYSDKLDAIIEKLDEIAENQGYETTEEKEEKKGILESIKDSVSNFGSSVFSGITSGLQSVFVPSASDFTDFSDDVDDLLASKLGVLSLADGVASDLVMDAVEDLDTSDSITFEGVSVPLRIASQNGGQSETVYFEMDEVEVPLDPAPDGEFDFLFDAVALAIDIVCTLAVLHMLRRRFEREVLGGEIE